MIIENAIIINGTVYMAVPIPPLGDSRPNCAGLGCDLLMDGLCAGEFGNFIICPFHSVNMWQSIIYKKADGKALLENTND